MCAWCIFQCCGKASLAPKGSELIVLWMGKGAAGKRLKPWVSVKKSFFIQPHLRCMWLACSHTVELSHMADIYHKPGTKLLSDSHATSSNSAQWKTWVCAVWKRCYSWSAYILNGLVSNLLHHLQSFIEKWIAVCRNPFIMAHVFWG